MASNDAGKVRAKRYNEQGKPYERRRSIIGFVTDTVRGLFSRATDLELANPPSTSNANPETEQNHIQHTSGSNTCYVRDNDLGQSYLQPPVSVAPLPGPSKLLPQMHVGSSQSRAPAVLHQMESQAPTHRLDAQASRTDHMSFSSDHLPFMPYSSKPAARIVNGGDDRSELSECSVSTSGCSSMPPHQEKQDFPQDSVRLPESRLHLRPGLSNSNKDLDLRTGRPNLVDQSPQSADNSQLWAELSTRFRNPTDASLNSSTTSRSRAPSFNVSIFGRQPSNSGRSILGSGLNRSHFYPGKTTFYGSSSSSSKKKRKLQDTSPTETPSKRQVQARSLSSSITGVSSTSARRILKSLDRMSSPVQDAKKIPSYNSSLADSPLSFTPRSYANAARRRTVSYRLDSSNLFKGPPVHALSTPGRIQIAKNYHLSLPKRQETESTRTGNMPQASTSHSYSPSSEGSRPGKLKQSRGHYSSKKAEDDVVVGPDLPTSFTLPVTAMPKFDFQSASTCSQPSRPSPSITKVSNGQYTFSTPIPQSIPDMTTSCTVQKFQFSSPITMDSRPASSINLAVAEKSAIPSVTTSTPLVSRPDLAFKFSSPATKRKSVESGSDPDVKRPAICSPEPSFKEQLKTGSLIDVNRKISIPASPANSPASGGLQPATELKKGSVMDILGDKKKSASTMKVNGGDDVTPTQPSLSVLFKKSSKTWECTVCMIQNEDSVSQCVACEAAKPGSKAEPPQPSVSTIPVDKAFAEKFKKPEGAWECNTCLVTNVASAPICIACDAPKPGQAKGSNFISEGGFKIGPTGGFQFQSPSSTASSIPSSNIGSTFGQTPSQDQTDSIPSRDFKFGAPLDSKPSDNNGNNLQTVPTAGFQFGQSLGNSNKDSSHSGATGGLKFGQSLGSSDNAKTDSSTTGGFKLGSQLDSTNTDGNKASEGGLTLGGSSIKSSGSFVFDVTTKENSANKTDSTSNTKSSATGMFTFGGSGVNQSAMCKPSDLITSTASQGFSVKPTAGVTFGSGLHKPTDSVPILSSAANKSTVTFGIKNNDAPAAVTAATTAAPAATAAGSGIFAGQNPPVPSGGGFTMSQSGNAPAVQSTETKPASSFNFDKQSKETTTTSTTAAGNQFAFGAAPKSEDNKPATAPSFNFGQPAQPTNTPAFGAPSAQSTASTAAPSLFSFGGSAQTSAGANPMPAPAFNFGAKPANPQAAAANANPPAFNFTGVKKPVESTTPATNAASSFAFSARSPESPMLASPPPTATGAFQFSQSAAQDNSMSKPGTSATTASSGGFAFGGQPQPTTTTAAAAPAPAPTFGSQSTNAFGFGNFPKSASSPTFGAIAKTEESSMFGTNTAAPAFGAPSVAPTFGAPGVTAPAFGSTTGPPAFGSTSTAPGFGQSAPAANTGVFQFGQSAPATTAPNSGFNFAQNQQPVANSAASTSFGATNAPPAYNFSGSQQPANFSFNAPQQAASSANPFSVTPTATTARRPMRKATRKLLRKL